MKEVEFRVIMEVEDSFIEKTKKFEHHAEYILDLDSYPEIKNIHDCTVKEVVNKK